MSTPEWKAPSPLNGSSRSPKLDATRPSTGHTRRIGQLRPVAGKVRGQSALEGRGKSPGKSHVAQRVKRVNGVGDLLLAHFVGLRQAAGAGALALAGAAGLAASNRFWRNPLERRDFVGQSAREGDLDAAIVRDLCHALVIQAQGFRVPREPGCNFRF